jgi:hypothetical protein
MTTRHLQLLALSLLAAAALSAAACGASNRPQATPQGQGRLRVSLVDNPAPEVSQVVVNVTRVTAHHDAQGWITLTPPGMSEATPLAVDLLSLQAPAPPLDLGLANLPPGHVTQLRLYVTRTGNFVVLADGTTKVPLKVPSGAEAGIKVKGPWDIVACHQLSLVVDFDAKRSISLHPAKHGSEWILRPVIRAVRQATEPVGCDTGCSDANPCPAGQACNADHQCVTETPAGPGPFGTACQDPAECLTGVCDETRHCGPGGASAPCQSGADCVSGVCDEGACTVPSGALSAGGSCFFDADCLSNACVDSACGLGSSGAACGVDEDCAEGLSCRLGTCALP